MRQFVPKTTYLHRLVVLAVFVSALLLGSSQVSDDDTGPFEPQCVIESLETITVNYPAESVEIDVEFALPQRESDVSQMLAGLELQPFALSLLRGDDAIQVGGSVRSIEHAIDATQILDAEVVEPCLSEASANNLQNQRVNEHSCEIRITRLKLRGPASAALAFRDMADSVATTSRIPSDDEVIRLIKALSRYPGEPNAKALNCA